MARFSNSALETFLECPAKYQTRYELGLVPNRSEPDYLLFGHRFHQILQAHYTGAAIPEPPENISRPLEAECQAVYERYKASYPVEDFEAVECEKLFEIPLPLRDCSYNYKPHDKTGFCSECEEYINRHTLIGRIDMLIRRKIDGKPMLLETKTEKHGSKRNLPNAWIARHQGSLYAFVASEVFKEPIDTVLLNVITRGTPKGQVGPGFRREPLHRTPQQIAEALKTANWVGDNIDRGVFPQATDETCVNQKGYECEYYGRCHRNDESNLITIEPYGYHKL